MDELDDFLLEKCLMSTSCVSFSRVEDSQDASIHAASKNHGPAHFGSKFVLAARLLEEKHLDRHFFRRHGTRVRKIPFNKKLVYSVRVHYKLGNWGRFCIP